MVATESGSSGLSGRAFLASSRDPLPDEGFAGYCFVGTDFVAGSAGFAAYRAAGGAMPLAEDGCYVHHYRAGETQVFSCDHSGYHKLFYFCKNGFWAASNSLWQLAAAMRDAGFLPQPDAAEIAAMEAEGTIIPTGRGMFFGQLSTVNCIIRDVQLLPQRHVLHVGTRGAQICPLPPRPRPRDYAEGLAKALGVWRARIAGLVAGRAVLSADLTGGLDSRTVLAILLSGGDKDALFLKSNLNSRGRADLRIAQRIAAGLGLRHNQKLPRSAPPLTGGQAFETWRDICLGSYHPIYFPRQAATAGLVHFGGGGGENQRAVYDRSLWARLMGLDRLDRFIAARRRNLRVADHRDAYGEALRKTFDLLQAQDGNSGVHPLILHYRAFRNRFHAGRTPQYILSINPIASALFDDCAALAGPERLTRGQLFYDIMESLVPGLADYPFDKRRKAPDASVRAALCRVTPEDHAPGRVFAPPPGGRPARGDGGPSAFEHLAALYAEARPLAAKYLAQRYLRRADRELQHAVRTKGFSHPNRSKRIGVVCAFALFLPKGGTSIPE